MSSVVSFIKTRHSYTVYSVLSSHTIMQLRSVVYVEYWCDCTWCTILHKIRTGELILELFDNIATDSLFLSYSCLKQGLELSKKHHFETLTKVRTPALKSVSISNVI